VENKPLHLDLGTLLLDNATIHFDKESNNKLDKDNKADLIQCEVAWDRKVEFELKKRAIIKVRTKIVKHKKWSTVVHVNNSGANVENVLSTNRMIQKSMAKAVKKEEEVEETTVNSVWLWTTRQYPNRNRRQVWAQVPNSMFWGLTKPIPGMCSDPAQ
jgi:hypothetical protein